MKRASAGDLALLIRDKMKFIFCLDQEDELQTHHGILRHSDLIGQPWGSRVKTHLGEEFLFLEPTLRDVLLTIRRKSQIVYPKDIGYILLRLSIGPGKRVLESGTGSGGLTTALAWAVGPAGKVISYDRRADMQALARKNLEMTGLAERVDLITQDIEEGLGEHDVDALFLDLPHPHLYLNSVRQVLTNGGTFGAILPTANQVSLLLQALEDHRFTMIDVCETILRFYKVVPQRFRPQDRMVAHTGYLIFARSLLESSGGQRQR